MDNNSEMASVEQQQQQQQQQQPQQQQALSQHRTHHPAHGAKNYNDCQTPMSSQSKTDPEEQIFHDVLYDIVNQGFDFEAVEKNLEEICESLQELPKQKPYDVPPSMENQSWKSNEARRPKDNRNIPKDKYCTVCNKCFASSSHLKRHYNTKVHKNAEKQRDLSRSPELSTSGSPPNLMAGPSGEATGSLLHTPTNLYTTSNSSNSNIELSQHRTHHPAPGAKNYNDCQTPMFSESSLAVQNDSPYLLPHQQQQQQQQRQRQQQQQQRHQCIKCEKTFDKCGYLQQHVDSCHSGKKFRCFKCGKHFEHQEQLDYHLPRHYGQKPYKCDKCDKSYNYKADRKVHHKNNHEKC